MPRWKCCVPNCKSLLTEGAVLHTFPNPSKNREKYNTWVINAGIDGQNEDRVFKDWRICHRHFEQIYHYPKNRLSKMAVPTLHLPNLNEKAAIEKHNFMPTGTNDEALLPNDTGSLCLTEEPLTTAKENLPLLTESMDCVDESAVAKESMVEFGPNEEFSLHDIAPSPKHTNVAKEDPPKKDKYIQPVIQSEMYTERMRANNATTRLATGDTTYCVTKDTTCRAPQQTSQTQDNYKKYWQSKLSHIVHSTQFCGVCLSTDDDVNSVYDQFEIVVCERSHAATLADILRVVFTETENFISNSFICNSCTNKLIQSYMFIQQARETSRILNCHVNDLYDKSCFLNNNTLNHFNQEQTEVKNALISLENYDSVDRVYNMYKTERSIKVEKKLNRPKLKRKFKCLRCNLYLPSYKTWLLHEISTHHRNNKYSTTQSNLTRSNVDSVETTRVLRRTCKICHRIIENGELTEHMQKYHAKSPHVCSICNVTFSSFEDFVTHEDEWHYRADSKCLTCLESYSEVELEQHQCRFGCGSCAEVPCVHHKYLMCYREQILNGALRAKCLDCQCVCRTKEALLSHVNLCHLKHRPKIP